jgi:hypothetical protein
MEASTAGRTNMAEKKKRWALKGHAQVNLLSYSMSRTMWASRHDLLVIGDNTNNMAEYEALLLGLKKAMKMGLKCLRVEGYF